MYASRIILVVLLAAIRSAVAGVDVEEAVAMAQLAAPFDTDLQEWHSHRRKLGARRVERSALLVEDPDPDDLPQTLVTADPVLGTALLSRVNFRSAVFEPSNITDLAAGVDAEVVEEWVVEFCAHWHSPCKSFAPLFDEVGEALEEEHNRGRAVTKRVRFARVNCATDKALCNAELVEDYPSVNHYKGRQLVDQWTSRGEKTNEVRLQKWLHNRLAEAAAAPAAERPQEAAEGMAWEAEDLAHSVGVGLLGLWAFWQIARLDGASAVDAPEGSPKAPAAASATPAAARWPLRGEAPRLFPQAWAQERHCIEL